MQTHTFVEAQKLASHLITLGYRVDLDLSIGSTKAVMRKASKMGAKQVVILPTAFKHQT